jgi:hypothetical protein
MRPDDFPGREVLSGGFIGDFRELSNQLLENRPHLCIGDGPRVEIDPCKLLGHLVQKAGFGETVDLGVEVEALEDVADWKV